MSRGHKRNAERELGEAISVYFGYAHRPLLEQLRSWQDAGAIPSLSWFIVKAVEERAATFTSEKK